MTSPEQRRRAGHAFIERKWPVLMLAPGTSRPMSCELCYSKSPRYVPHHGIEDCPHAADYCHGFHAATLDHGKLDSWLGRVSNANLGIATEPAGLVVVDCDTAGGRHGQITDAAYQIEGVSDGLDVFALALIKYRQQWPETLTVDSPSGGLHLWWTLPDGTTIRSRNGFFGPLVDVKSSRAYIVAPTSSKPAGEYRRWRGTDEPSPAPAWLLHHLKATGHYPPPPQPPRQYRRRGAADAAEGLRALDVIADKLARADEGTRHAQLCTATTAAAHLVADGRVTEDQALDAMRDAGYAAERDGREIDDAWRTALAKTGGR